MVAGLAGRPPWLPQSGPYGCWVSWETSLSTTQSGPYGCWVSWETSLSTTQSGPYGCWARWETSLSTAQSGPYGCWVSWGSLPYSQVLMVAGRPPCLPHSQVLIGAGLAGRPHCLPHSQVLMGAGLAGRPPCLPRSEVLMDAGLDGRPPCLPHSQVLMDAGLVGRSTGALNRKQGNYWTPKKHYTNKTKRIKIKLCAHQICYGQPLVLAIFVFNVKVLVIKNLCRSSLTRALTDILWLVFTVSYSGLS